MRYIYKIYFTDLNKLKTQLIFLEIIRNFNKQNSINTSRANICAIWYNGYCTFITTIY